MFTPIGNSPEPLSNEKSNVAVLNCCFKKILLFLVVLIAVSGFKTFAQKTNLPSPAATSNVLEAIQWQSVRLAKKSPQHNAGKESARQMNSDCNNTTFHLRIPAPAGTRLELSDMETLPGGDYCLAITQTLADNKKLGILMRLTNGGAIVNTQQIIANGNDISLSKIKVRQDGSIVVSGMMQDGSNSILLGILNNDFSQRWMKVIDMPDEPKKVTVDVWGDSVLTYAVQLNQAIVFSASDVSGIFKWQRKIDAPGLSELVGFSNFNYDAFGLVQNSVVNGVAVSEIIEVDIKDGQVTQSHVKDDPNQVSRALALTSFSQRASIVTINQNGVGFNIQRDIYYGSQRSETRHTHSYSTGLNLNIQAAMDNSGDVVAVSIPNEGRLLVLNQFASYNSPLLFSKTYSLPVGSTVSAVARSFDRGIFTGLNGPGNQELILLKTDSTGVLSGCDYQVAINNSDEKILLDNHPISYVATNEPGVAVPLTTSNTAVNLASSFLCNSNYCPIVQDSDTCNNTYYKTLRSSSYMDHIDAYYLMRNNIQMLVATRLDRIIGDQPTATGSVKLLKENGEFIKATNFFLNNESVTGAGFLLDDRSILLSVNASSGNESRVTFICLSDDLQVLWKTNITNPGNFNNGLGKADVHKDASGNYFLVSALAGFMNIKSRLSIVKLDPSANIIWQRSYEIDKGLSVGVAATTSATSLYAIVTSTTDESVAFQVDKTTGDVQNAQYFNSLASGSETRRYAKFENKRVVYVGNDQDDKFVAAIFDENARPIMIKRFDDLGLLRAATFHNGFVYTNSWRFDGMFEKNNIAMKLDANLNVVFARDYTDGSNSGWRISGIGVGSNGSIYTGGNIYADHDIFPYIAKFDSAGYLGACATGNVIPAISNLSTQTTSASHALYSFNSIRYPDAVTQADENVGLNIANVVCKTPPECTSIRISGSDTLCDLSGEYFYEAIKPPLCTSQAQWSIDTSMATITRTTGTGIYVKFKRVGFIKLAAWLNGGCKIISDTLLLVVQRPLTALSLGNDRVLCPGDTLHLNAGPGFSVYKWQDLSFDSVLIVHTPGNYSVEVSNACGDKSTDMIVVTPALVPTISFGNDTLVCSGTTLKLLAPLGFNAYEWAINSNISGSNQTMEFLISRPASIRLSGITAHGCSAKDSIFVSTKTARPLFLGNDTSVCAPASVSWSPTETYQSYVWNDGSINASLTANNAGKYWLHATDFNGCVATDTVNLLAVYPKPQVNLGNDFDLCAGTSARLDAGSFSTYEWMDGSNARYYSADRTGSYFVTVTDQRGCNNSDTVVIKNMLPVPTGFLPAVDSLCQYESIFLTPSVSFADYSWSNGSSTPRIEVEQPGNYILQVRDDKGCTGSDTISVVLKNCMMGLFIPTAFTPNGDEVNDIFRAKAYGKVISFKLEVYDRFGNLVYKTTDPKAGWDGTQKGITMPTGIFAWQCYCQFEGMEPVFKKGVVTLIR